MNFSTMERGDIAQLGQILTIAKKDLVPPIFH
jgi:hypothetical protein